MIVDANRFWLALESTTNGEQLTAQEYFYFFLLRLYILCLALPIIICFTWMPGCAASCFRSAMSFIITSSSSGSFSNCFFVYESEMRRIVLMRSAWLVMYANLIFLFDNSYLLFCGFGKLSHRCLQ